MQQPNAVVLQPAGHDGVLTFVPDGMGEERVIRHGSSLDLLSKSTQLINEEFAEIDPEQDYEKWRCGPTRGEVHSYDPPPARPYHRLCTPASVDHHSKLGARTYFFSIIEPGSEVITCTMRIQVLVFNPDPSPPLS